MNVALARGSDHEQTHWPAELVFCRRQVSILRSAVLPTTNGTGLGEEHAMSTTAGVSEPASELERLIADLSGSGLQGSSTSASTVTLLA